jgi:MOSC domain-containing protein YiiM
MNDIQDVDLNEPFTPDRILEIRTSRMKTMPGLTIQSGIDKTIRDGVVQVSELGIEGDEHDPTFHGGVDKAILGCKKDTAPLFCASLSCRI